MHVELDFRRIRSTSVIRAAQTGSGPEPAQKRAPGRNLNVGLSRPKICDPELRRINTMVVRLDLRPIPWIYVVVLTLRNNNAYHTIAHPKTATTTQLRTTAMRVCIAQQPGRQRNRDASCSPVCTTARFHCALASPRPSVQA
jgi:hypothetical protein